MFDGLEKDFFDLDLSSQSKILKNVWLVVRLVIGIETGSLDLSVDNGRIYLCMCSLSIHYYSPKEW